MIPIRPTTCVHSIIFIHIDFKLVCSSPVNKQEEMSQDVNLQDGGKYTLLRYVILKSIKKLIKILIYIYIFLLKKINKDFDIYILTFTDYEMQIFPIYIFFQLEL